ncbi:unnamed protein product [Cuscuta campestris]|uniref:Retrovirus-related Pol polyprotein from transposon TNT 1-94-like beta-barrel domain-containing protein n=1 Tax=Cuscuta campestris TaxID=132261 RepID=A0A484MRW5_9ASTE|nr:unnamed protein product [Cuscuta campestris]
MYERNPAAPDVVQYIPKPKEKWDDRDCKKHNLDNVAKAAIFKTLDPITFSKIKHLKTAMEIWQGLGKLCEGSEDLRKQKIEVLLEKFKSFKMLLGESFDMLDERFHKILNDLSSLNHILSPKKKNVRLLSSLPTEWYTKATAMEEGRNLENYTVQGLLDELRTYEHELKKKKEEQVTPFPTALMTTSRIPSSEGTCTRNCDTPSSSQPSSSKMENYDEEFAMMVKQFRKFKKFFKKADSIRRPSKGKPQVEKYGERERIEKKKKVMVAAESDESSSSSSDEEALVCMERRVEKSNHEDRWTMSEDDTLCLMAKDDADQEEAAKYPGVWYLDSGCSRHMTGDASLLSNLIPYDGPRVTFGGRNDFGLTKGLGNLVYKGLIIQAVSYVEGLNYNLLSISQFCDKGYSLEFCKDMASLKNISTNEVILTGKRIRNIYEVIWNDVKEACLISKGDTNLLWLWHKRDRPSAPLRRQNRRMESSPCLLPLPSSTKDYHNSLHSSPFLTKFHSILLLGVRRTWWCCRIGVRSPELRAIVAESFTRKSSKPSFTFEKLEAKCNSPTFYQSYLEMIVAQELSEFLHMEIRFKYENEVLEFYKNGKKLEAKCSSPTFYQSYLEMIAAQELSEFLHMEIRFKYENEVLEFYKNGKVKTVKSKKDPQRTIQVINSTVGGTKVKLSQKKLGEKLHLPNSGVEIGRLPAKNLDWNIIGIFGQAPSGPAKKTNLNNDYKLVLELVIACLECGSGGHADDITLERAFIINALITKSKNLNGKNSTSPKLLLGINSRESTHMGGGNIDGNKAAAWPLLWRPATRPR